jgi:hypothetical protein
MTKAFKICIQRAETRQEWDAMQDDYISRAVVAADRIEQLEAALKELLSLGSWGTNDLARTIILEALETNDA